MTREEYDFKIKRFIESVKNYITDNDLSNIVSCEYDEGDWDDICDIECRNANNCKYYKENSKCSNPELIAGYAYLHFTIPFVSKDIDSIYFYNPGEPGIEVANCSLAGLNGTPHAMCVTCDAKELRKLVE